MDTSTQMPNVVPLEAVDIPSVFSMLQSLGMTLELVSDGEKIPGTFWGEPEAGLINNGLYARPDTPVHSLLHESCHYACMDDQRKINLHTNAGGTLKEEDAVCYLQILLSDQIEGYGREQCFKDMDAWGYTFRLGSAQAWFERDAEDAYEWLESRQLLPQ